MALPTHIHLEIVTPDRLLVREEVDEVEIPGSEGYFGVLPGHTPLLASLKVGEMWYRKGQERTYLGVAFGFVEVLPDRVTILARAEAARKRAEARLAQQMSDVDYERAQAALMKSIMRLQLQSRTQLAGRVGRQRMPPPQD